MTVTRALGLEDDNGNVIQVLSIGVNIGPVDVTATPAETTEINGTAVYISLTVAAHVYIGPSGTDASTSMLLLPAGQVFIFKCAPTDIVSFVKPSGGTDGKAYVQAAGR